MRVSNRRTRNERRAARKHATDSMTPRRKSPKNPRYGLMHAKILYKQGKKDEALRVIADANAWAKESNNANYVEQTQLFWDSIK